MESILKGFLCDENSRNYSNKLKVASILWKEVRNSKAEKIYSKNLLTEYLDKIKGMGVEKSGPKLIVHEENLMLGAIIGDIIGSVYEWNNIKQKDLPLFRKDCFLMTRL